VSVAHVEFLVEEQSAETALREILPKVMPGVSFGVYPHGGKEGLVKVVPGRQRATLPGCTQTGGSLSSSTATVLTARHSSDSLRMPQGRLVSGYDRPEETTTGR
jgi:hypothetical protein